MPGAISIDEMKKLVDTLPKSMTERVFVVRTALDTNMQKAADLAVEKLGGIGGETKRLQADPGYVDSVLKDGSARARSIAAPIVRKAREIVGFVVS